MMKLLFTVILLLSGLLPAQGGDNPWITPPVSVDAGYPVPQPDKTPSLPEAHAAHPEFAIEWWYWVGHLREVGTGKELGFQSTVFRLAGEAGAAAQVTDPAAFGGDQLFMSHAALSELTEGKYQFVERIHRNGWQARASTQRLDLAAGPITARQETDHRIHMILELPENTRLTLEMVPTKPLIAFGERGLSRKGSDPAAVSWYWTYPRLKTSGQLERGGRTVKVEGIAWMDHEISSSQLGGDLEGWDWTAIQLDDGTEVKAYRLRQADGGMDPWSACYWIDVKGETARVYARDFTWTEAGNWISPSTGIRYPNEVVIEARHPGSGTVRHYRLRPLLDSQEFLGLRDENPYWEGACTVLDAAGNAIGRAYLELAGYGGGLGRQLNANQ
jgi:predicted secreted hydrolase